MIEVVTIGIGIKAAVSSYSVTTPSERECSAQNDGDEGRRWTGK
jgi:hypothetical protein